MVSESSDRFGWPLTITAVADIDTEVMRVRAELASVLRTLLINLPTLPQTTTAALSVQPLKKSGKFGKILSYIKEVVMCLYYEIQLNIEGIEFSTWK
jgi:hypothetical protein